MHAPYDQLNQQHTPHMLKFNISMNLMKNMTISISDTEPRSLYRRKEHKQERQREKEMHKVEGESKVNRG